VDKELLYRTLNNILDSMESGHFTETKTQIEGLIREIQFGVYDND
tara:strand:+ start:116 stop:250 length:135 start_codon:yes stop_codon:yes gene_type:complete